jgi:ATP-dependent helicase/nuclease subunit B
MDRPARAGELQRLVIACIPDLPLAAQHYAQSLESLGVRVEVLVWMPDGLFGGFDAWGRPDPVEWAECRLDIEPHQISMAGSAEDEATRAIDCAVSAQPPGDYAVVLADPNLGSAFRTVVESRGGTAFLPNGTRLETCEAGVLALEWTRFRSSGALRTLRRLLELPRFNNLVRGGSELTGDDCLAVCDYLIGEAVLSEAGPEKEKSQRRAQSAVFVALLKSLLPLAAPELLAKAWRSGGDGLEEARKVATLHRTIRESPLYRGRREAADHAFARALKAESVFSSSNPGDVELQGWLEAPWIEAKRLVLCGCVEGTLPSSVNGHPFLPDSKRKPLGLADNASRFARDAYLFKCQLLLRSATEFRVSFSRFDAEGSPALPSSLFLRCGREALPERVLELFGDPPPGRAPAQRGSAWRWSLPENLRRKVEKISPTDFAEYLACPFRYYLKRVQWLDAFTPDAREMDARRFGTLIHEALERFGRETPNEADPAKIELLVLGHLREIAHGAFGPNPSPAITIQMEAAKARLRAFARIQTEQFAAGWRIVAVERKLDAGSDDALRIGPLKLSGKIDRIEKNEVTGAWRVLDYKTHPKATKPSKKHFGPQLHGEWLPSAEFDHTVSGKTKKRRWMDLQLPLYRYILSHWHGPEIGDHPASTAYFTLPADPAETAVEEFTELNNDTMESAMRCAAEIAALVNKGRFWPPQPFNGSWNDPFGAIFLNGKPEACFTEETIAFLKGTE